MKLDNISKYTMQGYDNTYADRLIAEIKAFEREIEIRERELRELNNKAQVKR